MMIAEQQAVSLNNCYQTDDISSVLIVGITINFLEKASKKINFDKLKFSLKQSLTVRGSGE